MAPAFNQTAPGYRNLWSRCKITPERRGTVERVARTIIDDKKRWYLDVQEKTGVPWFWVACVHHRESGGDFAGVLHNGEKIIGTGRKTTLVPKGRGPFNTWRESANDALRLKKLHEIDAWPIERVLYEFERYNGWGYYGRINSPYVWAASNLQQRGKYVKDGVFDPNAWDQQLGTAPLLKALIALDPSISEQLDAGGNGTTPPDPDDPDETYEQKRDRLIAALEAHTGGKVAILFD